MRSTSRSCFSSNKEYFISWNILRNCLYDAQKLETTCI